MKYSLAFMPLLLLLSSFAIGHLTGGGGQARGHGHGHVGVLGFLCDPASWLFPKGQSAPKIPHLVVSPQPFQFHLTSLRHCSIWDSRPHDDGLILIHPDTNTPFEVATALFRQRKKALLDKKKFLAQQPFNIVLRIEYPQTYQFKVSLRQILNGRYRPIESDAITMPKPQRGPKIMTSSYDYLVASQKVDVDPLAPIAQVSPGWIEYGNMDQKCDPEKTAPLKFTCYYFQIYAQGIGRKVYMKIENELQSSHNLELWKLLTPATSGISLESEAGGQVWTSAEVAIVNTDEAPSSSSSWSSSTANLKEAPSLSSSGSSPNADMDGSIPFSSSGASPLFKAPPFSSTASTAIADTHGESLSFASQSDKPPNGVVTKWIPKAVSVRSCFAKPQADGASGSRSERMRLKQQVKIGSQYEDCYPLLESQRIGSFSRMPFKKKAINAAETEGKDALLIPPGESGQKQSNDERQSAGVSSMSNVL